MGAHSARRMGSAGGRLLAGGLVLLLLAAFARPILPMGQGSGVGSFVGDDADYTLDTVAPEQSIAVAAQAGGLVKRIGAGDGFDALAPAPQARPGPVARSELIAPAPDERPPPPIVVSRNLTTGPPRLEA
jgi:hypothetical protein